MPEPRRFFRPDELLEFIELSAFTKRWAKLGLDDEGDLSALQLSIMAAPRKAKVVKGTDGIRKMRFSPPRWRVGTSGAVRVLYVHFEELGIVLLCLAYGKNEVDDISDAVAKQLNSLVREIRQELRRRHG